MKEFERSGPLQHLLLRYTQELIAIAKAKPGQLNHGFDAVIRADVRKWAKIIKDAGIRAQ